MATATYKAAGNRVDYTPDGAYVDAGDVVALNEMYGIATQDIADGDKGSLAVDGIFTMPKATGTGEDIDQGDTVYWDGSVATETGSAGIYLGKCAADAATDDSAVDVLINVNE